MMRSTRYNNSMNTWPITTNEVSKWSMDIKKDRNAITVKYGILQINLQYVQ